MIKRSGLLGAGLLTAALPGCTAENARATRAAGSTIPERPQRVLWIVMDSVRADHLNFLGYDRATAPWMSELADRSVVFEHAYAASDHTLRSVPSYMTSRYVSFLHANMWETSHGVPSGRPTVAGSFHDAGFKTLGWSTNPWVSDRRGVDQGFDFLRLMLPIGNIYARIDEVIDQVRLDYTKSEGREFIYIHLMDTHVPFIPPMPFDRAFTERTEAPHFRRGVLIGDDQASVFSNLRYYSEHHRITQASIDLLVSQYDGAILYTDDRLPRLLESLGHDADKDLVVLMSDHGEQFFERGFYGHARSAHIEETHVPVLFHWNGLSPRRDSTACGLVDLYPTFADFFGLKAPDDLCGRSLAERLSGKPEESPRTLFCEGNYANGLQACAIGDDYYYYQNSAAYRQLPWQAWPFEQTLFDLKSDPKCLKDIHSDRTDPLTTMNAKLRELNPRYNNCRAEALIQAPGWTPDLGEDLFAPDNGSDWMVNEPKSFVGGGGAINVLVPRRVGVLVGAVDSRGFYVLRVGYELWRGGVRFRLVTRAEEPKELWRLDCYRATGGVRSLDLTLDLRPEAVEFQVDILSAQCRFHVSRPQLFLASIASIGIEPFDGTVTETTRDQSLSAGERERLEALGYIE